LGPVFARVGEIGTFRELTGGLIRQARGEDARERLEVPCPKPISRAVESIVQDRPSARSSQPPTGTALSKARAVRPEKVPEITVQVGTSVTLVIIGNDARIVTRVPSPAVTVAVADAGTVATAGSLLESWIVVPPLTGAPPGGMICTLPVRVWPPTAGWLEKLTEPTLVVAGRTKNTLRLAGVVPTCAEIWVQPLAPLTDWIVKVLLVPLVNDEVKLTEDGTVATDGLELASCAVIVPLAGSASMDTVPVELLPLVTSAGETVTDVTTATPAAQTMAGRAMKAASPRQRRKRRPHSTWGRAMAALVMMRLMVIMVPPNS